MKLVFATHNNHKVEEVRAILGEKIELLSLADLDDHEEIIEDGSTLQENALIKAREVYRRHGLNCFADDTGLEVEALNGAPGVYSARYAGEQCSSKDNIEKLLKALKGKSGAERKAKFRTVIALIIDGEEHLFEGEVRGEITEEVHGMEGFGYDPIFKPEGEPTTFAMMVPEAKNAISHRGRATQNLVTYLQSLCK